MCRPTFTLAARCRRLFFTMSRFGVLLVVASTVACGGAASDDFTGPETLKITAATATSFTGNMGDLVFVGINVRTLDGGTPPFGAKVTFVASDGGAPKYPSIAVGQEGSGGVLWRFGAATKVQTLTVSTDGARPLVFKANVTGNAWKVTTTGSQSYVTRLADEGSISLVAGDAWANTLFGSPPRLIISCQAGTVGIALTHPKMEADGDSVAYSFDDSGSWTEEAWSQLAPRSDSLFHPGPASAPGTLAKRIAASSVFRMSYRQWVPASNFTTYVDPSFGTAGLSQVMPQLMANCPSGR